MLVIESLPELIERFCKNPSPIDRQRIQDDWCMRVMNTSCGNARIVIESHEFEWTLAYVYSTRRQAIDGLIKYSNQEYFLNSEVLTRVEIDV